MTRTAWLIACFCLGILVLEGCKSDRPHAQKGAEMSAQGAQAGASSPSPDQDIASLAKEEEEEDFGPSFLAATAIFVIVGLALWISGQGFRSQTW